MRRCVTVAFIFACVLGAIQICAHTASWAHILTAVWLNTSGQNGNNKNKHQNDTNQFFVHSYTSIIKYLQVNGIIQRQQSQYPFFGKCMHFWGVKQLEQDKTNGHFACKKHSKETFLECYLIAHLATNFEQSSSNFVPKLGWYFNKNLHSLAQEIVYSSRNTCKTFPSKFCIFCANLCIFLRTRGVFLIDVLHNLKTKLNCHANNPTQHFDVSNCLCNHTITT